MLFVCYGRPFGGAETYTGRLAQLLHNDIECFAFSGTPELTAYLKELGVRVIDYKPHFNDGQLWYAEFLLVCIGMLPYLRLKQRVDTVWIQGFRESFVLPWAWLMRFNTIATMHMTLVREFSQTFYPYLLYFADQIICVSQTVADCLPSFVPRKKISVIHNWVASHDLNRSTVLGDNRLLKLLYVGRLLKYKGAPLLIDAVRRLEQKYPEKAVSLEIVGEGKDRRELEAQAAGLNIIFVGFQNDPTNAYRRNDVFVNPTYGPEGSPLVSLEAMSHGLPVILSDLDVNREISRQGFYAKLFKRGSVEDLVDRLQEFLTSTAELEEYSRRSCDAIRERFSSEIAYKEYRRVLFSLNTRDLSEPLERCQ